MARQRHKALANMIRLTAQKRFGRRVRLFERHAGVMSLPGGGCIKPFMDGQADLYGWCQNAAGVAVHVEMELKVGRDRLRPDQEDWKAVCEGGGVAYAVVECREVEEGVQKAVAFLDEVSRG